jgi:transcriptional regulator with XRE-family HTH domain
MEAHRMPRQAQPDLSLVLNFMRVGQGWSQAKLSESTGISPKLINDYERGRKPLNRARLESMIAVMGLPPHSIETTLACLGANRASSAVPTDASDIFEKSRRRIETVSARAARMTGEFSRSFLTLLTFEGEALQARERAEVLWKRLARRSAGDCLALVEDSKKFRSWALCERVAAESIAAAPNHPRQALELAELARRIAELTPGSQSWQWRLQGYAWAHVSNARRVCNDLPGAEQAMDRAWKLWEDGATGDPGLLEETWLPGLDAALRRSQRRFSEALKRIDEALALDRGELRAQILITKASILLTLGDSEGSTLVLQEVVPLIDSGREPRLAFGVRFNLLVDLCRLGKAAEAERRLPEVRELAQRLGGELDLVRAVWLEGNIAAGLSRMDAAYAAFQQVRREFTVRELAYDCALVSLELAMLLLEQGRTAEVRTLVGEMLWIFRAQGVHREGLAALQIFYDAARKETATAELAQRLVSYLYQAQHDPELRFDPENGAEAS